MLYCLSSRPKAFHTSIAYHVYLTDLNHLSVLLHRLKNLVELCFRISMYDYYSFLGCNDDLYHVDIIFRRRSCMQQFNSIVEGAASDYGQNKEKLKKR